ncbi:hypothetical protein [Shewanella glacialipiscicola]|uniref:Uncharacterized protein n=1 Tax=Shewanella glacialipiscicola TaxID=614069 RepID=A0ABQ6J474_9GAMM|nr:hypothetical protein [Shewanella glacialipiscicola]MCL1085044.1 hypothetical protein [Shewanella glacialipiscicola]MCU7994953.1 hypothetical protein [Shewanella glacialipiscicola]MCU8026361.1 hypothetical protein [Shewanella glacialipiscicola]GIU15136.1 hypothetical protein TUM4636_27310 [Shewanella glacialipiscicola]GMA82928.1 hypothetical protein GCM10025855_24610 [Shewanella glacialipiscicola]
MINMKFMTVATLLCLSSTVSASQILDCNKDASSATCQSYLEGIIDGALMFKSDALGVRLETNGYESRALKYRGGKRFQEANRVYCAGRIPERDVLVSGVTEAVSLGNATDLEQLQGVVTNLLDCQRLQ